MIYSERGLEEGMFRMRSWEDRLYYLAIALFNYIYTMKGIHATFVCDGKCFYRKEAPMSMATPAMRPAGRRALAPAVGTVVGPAVPV
mgnify:CR=1 FL=1